MSGDEGRDEDVVEVGEGDAGEAEEVEATRSRGIEAPPTPSELDELQERFRETRRWGGPELEPETGSRGVGEEDVPDLEPTETEDETETEGEEPAPATS